MKLKLVVVMLMVVFLAGCGGKKYVGMEGHPPPESMITGKLPCDLSSPFFSCVFYYTLSQKKRLLSR